ncbi:hypothetical protein [Pseudomonas phage HMGUpa2]|uniref:Uncharacterized protein n=2 Tax=Bruynoghevirus TaxID=545932 RepID=L7TIV6_9CAUD|nr:hypothetical protein [Pseudomonas aeruginosa]YP_009125619.1 hypothetical protein VC51_gp51 [Pseudomonas phage vB_PaeP_C2-10_Ab22]YP_009639037.1 hypothetical protein FGG60_gp51 [Pseudomonas phage PaP4]AYD79675.1 hypothetical protein JNAJLEEC_00050 [Pseudomonas phage phiPA01_302]AYJ73827.1 hypothetical protein [Pseudomonas phage SaPL]QDH46142.1 hypothetical protein Pa222_049 [Pseudomonas virus Pa222]QDH46212.1 hypothetical protein Pa223_051 [Pseudomonas virus Pa223]QVJ12815.1 hypothetical p
MAGYIADNDGNSVFVIQSKAIAVRNEDGTLRQVIGPKDFEPVKWEDIEGKPKLLEVGAKASEAKPGNWKPKASEVSGLYEAIAASIQDKISEIPVASYTDTHEALVDKFNTLLNALRS